MIKPEQPFFEPIFGPQWESMPDVFKRHYACAPADEKEVIVKGNMSVSFSLWFKLLKIFMPTVLPPIAENDIPVVVKFSCQSQPLAFCFHRTFSYPNRKPFVFKSKMLRLKDNILVEITRFNLGYKAAYCFQDNQIYLRHKGYVLKLFRWYLPLPLGVFLGRCDSREWVISDDSFGMEMHFTHPIFGNIYEYKGIFSL